MDDLNVRLGYSLRNSACILVNINDKKMKSDKSEIIILYRLNLSRVQIGPLNIISYGTV